MKAFLILVLVAAAFAGGYGYGRWYGKPLAPAAKSERKVLYWVDPMHPAYRSDKPGIAPDCGMDLVPVYEDGSQGASSVPQGMLHITPEKQQAIGVEFGEVRYTAFSGTMRAAGKVVVDETRIAKIQAKFDGWIDQLFVSFTGQAVEKGRKLLTIYSPELLATQQEFLLAMKAEREMKHHPMAEIAASNERLVAAARKRLELWDISAEQIDQVAQTGEPLKNLTLYAPISGIVTARNAYPKQKITPETELFTVVDLSTVWVIADVFEYEADEIRVGMPVKVSVSGNVFRGRVNFILPQVDPQTRTLKVRIEAPNPSLALKPDMFADVEFQTGGGRALTVPQEAVLDSGEHKTVFVDRGAGMLEARKVEVGRTADGRYEILSGLKEGERIVVSGNFLVDSESQLKAATGSMTQGKANDHSRH